LRPLNLIQPTPLVWAHRGGRSLAAENTLSALRKAHETGAHGWETDVQITKDGEVILLHDLGLLRSTNAGVKPLFMTNKPVVPWRFTLKEIHTLSANIFPSRKCPPTAGKTMWREEPEYLHPDHRVPTLREGLALTRELGMWINVELKDLSKAVPASLTKDIVEKVITEIEAMGMEDQVILSSFNHDYMGQARQLRPHILTGLLTTRAFIRDPLPLLRKFKADAWHPNFRPLKQGTVESVREAGYAINPYTVNDPKLMHRFIDWGVTGIVTDRPQDIA